MEVVRPAVEHLLALVGQARQIGVQYRRSDLTVTCTGAHLARSQHFVMALISELS